MTEPAPSGGDRSDVDDEIAATPLPTRSELRRRSSLVRQFVRFVVLNVKILKLSRQHHDS